MGWSSIASGSFHGVKEGREWVWDGRVLCVKVRRKERKKLKSGREQWEDKDVEGTDGRR